MKTLLLTIYLFLAHGTAIAEDLISINNERIAEIALKHLLEDQPSLKKSDLEAKLIHVTTHPNDSKNLYINTSVDFIFLPSKEHRCESVILSPDLAAVLNENEKMQLSKQCGNYFRGYSVSFDANQQNGPAKVRETSFGPI